MADSAFVLDVGDADFAREVLERSATTPVVVDFWAPWCAPCRALGPVLERLAEEHAGAFVLARVNVDEAREVAARFGVRGIPLVVGIREGRAAAELQGAQPEAEVRRFLARVLPTPADRLAREAEERAAGGDAEGAEAKWREALALDERHPPSLVGLARALGARGALGEARALLERVVPGGVLEREAERLAAELRTRDEGGGDVDALRVRVETRPDDLEARLALGRALAARACYEPALAELLAVVRSDPGFADEAARRAMLDVFEVLGSDHELTQRYRSALAAALYR